MAEVTFEQSQNIKGLRKDDLLGKWVMRFGDTATPILVGRFSDKSIHIFAENWNGASIAMMCSNDETLTQFDPAHDSFDMPIVQTANAKPWTLSPATFALKPVLTGGDSSTVITISIFGHGDH